MLDAFVSDVLHRKMTVRIQLTGFPDWARDPGQPDTGIAPWLPPVAPNELARWKQFVGDVAHHFRGRVTYFEIWNEPNISSFFYPIPDPAEYADLLQASYTAIKAADPTARVIFAGMSGNDIGFLGRVYDALDIQFGSAAKRNHHYFDILGVHPYDGSRPPALVSKGEVYPDNFGTMDYNFLGFEKLHALMVSFGEGYKPIYITEYGFTTAGFYGFPAISDSTRARYLRQAFALVDKSPLCHGVQLVLPVRPPGERCGQRPRLGDAAGLVPRLAGEPDLRGVQVRALIRGGAGGPDQSGRSPCATRERNGMAQAARSGAGRNDPLPMRYPAVVTASPNTIITERANPPGIAPETVPQTAGDASGQGRANVQPLGGKRRAGACSPCDGGLRDPLRVAAAQEVAEPYAVGLDMVADLRERNMHELGSLDAPSNPDRELGLLAPERQDAKPAHLGVERAELVEDATAERHGRSDEVAHGRDRLRQAGVAAADDPVELGREPPRASFRPDGHGTSAGACHVWIVVLGEQLLEPSGIGLGVVVEKRDHITASHPHPRVARAGKALKFLVRDDLHVARKREMGAPEELVVVVDHHDALLGQAPLGPQGVDGPQQ